MSGDPAMIGPKVCLAFSAIVSASFAVRKPRDSL
jgi:hypothetical protein